MAERITGEQALLNAVARQRDEAMNRWAQAQAQADVALADNDDLRERLKSAEEQISTWRADALMAKVLADQREKRSMNDGHEVIDGAGAGPDGGQPGDADDPGV